MTFNYYTIVVMPALLFIEAIAAYYLLKYKKLCRLVKTTRTSRISDLGNGFHEINGKVTALTAPLISPYSEKPCVYYEFRVEKKRSIKRNPYEKGDNQPQWDGLIEDKKMFSFGVDDGSGVAMVDPEYARIELKSTNDFDSGYDNRMKTMNFSDRERVLKKYPTEDYGNKNKEKLRYRELLIEEGIQIHVMGQVQGKLNGYPLFKVQGQPLYISDHSEEDLIKLYKNRLAYSAAIMIGVPLGLSLFWFLDMFRFQ